MTAMCIEGESRVKVTFFLTPELKKKGTNVKTLSLCNQIKFFIAFLSD